MLDALSNAVSDASTAAYTKVAENEIKKYTGSDIDVVIKDVPAEHKDWVLKTGMNCLCVDDTWDFLEDSPDNKPKRDLWNKRGIKKIIVTIEKNPEEDMKDWTTAWVDWEEGSHEFTIRFYPRALQWGSGSNSWLESGYRTWWVLRDEIVFGLQLYQLPGKCFYKSDWLDNFEDVDPDGFLPSSKKKFKRWFQFRHWVLYWYPEAQPGYNYQWTEKPPKLPDGSDFSLDSILKLPSMPNLKMPHITLPSLPGMPSMPSLPSLPSLHAPSLSMPSLSMPSLSMPSLGSLPSMPERKKRPSNRWACHGVIEMNGLKVKAKGKTIVLSDATITDFWENKNGGIDDEKKEHARLDLECTSDEQATSWQLTLIAGGAEEGEIGGCCVVA